MTRDEVVESLKSQARAKEVWLETFGWGTKKRPAHEIQIKEMEMNALQEAIKLIQQEWDHPA